MLLYDRNAPAHGQVLAARSSHSSGSFRSARSDQARMAVRTWASKWTTPSRWLWMSEGRRGIMDGYYRIRFDGLALNGRATILLENGHIYGVKDEGQYDLAGRYSRQAKVAPSRSSSKCISPGALSTSPKRSFGRSRRSSASSSRCRTRRYATSYSQRPMGR